MLPRTMGQLVNSLRPEMALQVLHRPTAEPTEQGILGRQLGLRWLTEQQWIPVAQGHGAGAKSNRSAFGVELSHPRLKQT